MNRISKIIIVCLAIIMIGVIAFITIRNSKSNQSTDVTTNPYEFSIYVDSLSGITFNYNKDWIVEKKYSQDSSKWLILAHSPFEKEYLKCVTITISPYDDLEFAIKDWWIENYERLNYEENKVYFQHPKTHRYQGITYAANRAQLKHTNENGVYAEDYRLMSVRKNGQTILLIEIAEPLGMDGLEADGFIRIEKTIDIITK